MSLMRSGPLVLPQGDHCRCQSISEAEDNLGGQLHHQNEQLTEDVEECGCELHGGLGRLQPPHHATTTRAC